LDVIAFFFIFAKTIIKELKKTQHRNYPAA